MDFFEKINKKLDEGYQLTNSNCENCKFTILFEPVKNELYCTNCG